METPSNNDPSPPKLLDLPLPAGGPEWRDALSRQVFQLVSQKLQYRVSPRIRSVIGPEDIAQEALIRLLDHADKQQTYGDVSEAYVLVVAQRALVDAVRRYLAKKRAPEDGFANIAPTSSQYLLNDIGNSGPTASQVEIGKEFWVTATSMLNERDSEFLELRYNEGLNDEEIGQLFDKSPDSIRSIFFRIHKKLKQEFSQRPEYTSFF